MTNDIFIFTTCSDILDTLSGQMKKRRLEKGYSRLSLQAITGVPAYDITKCPQANNGFHASLVNGKELPDINDFVVVGADAGLTKGQAINIIQSIKEAVGQQEKRHSHKETSGGSGHENVSVTDFSKIIKQKDVQILDVRTPEEYATGHIEGALLADYNGPSFKEDALKVLDKGKKVAIYCRSGRRSAAAAQILAKEGFTLYNLGTGIIGWTKEGKKLVK